MPTITTLTAREWGEIGQDEQTVLRVQPAETPKLPLRPTRFYHRQISQAECTTLRTVPNA